VLGDELPVLFEQLLDVHLLAGVGAAFGEPQLDLGLLF
jgi:hypothetical protein